MNNTKIRLIFCDVDGTLLPRGCDKISDDVFYAIERAISSGVKFCVASGRSYTDLLSLFAPVKDKISFICNDGAMAVDKGIVLFSSPLNKNQVACMSKTYKNDYDAMLLYAKDYTYYIGNEDLSSVKKITSSNVSNIPGDIFKIAFLNLSQKAKIKLDNLGIKSGILNKIYEDKIFTEFIAARTNKGRATCELQRLYNVSYNETAAFGDNLNDIEMLRQAQHTFAPENAHHSIVRMCKYTTNNVSDKILNII